jgi:uncharacterized protein YxjI
MRYEMRQKLWTYKDDFVIRDAGGNEVFTVKSKVWSWGHQLTLADGAGNELAHIKQKLAAWGPTYEIEQDGAVVATVKKKIMSFRPHFDCTMADGSSITVDGNITDHEFTLARDGAPIATVSMKWFSMSDTYGVEIADGESPVLPMAIVVVIDMVCHADDKDD